MKNKVLKQMLAFSLAVALVGGNSVATFAAEPTNGTESSTNTQAATDATEATATFKQKNVTKKSATLWVAYLDENGHQVGTTQQKITKEGNDGENYTFNITNLNVPEGYELVKATWEKSVAYGDEEFVNVTVKKKEAKKADAVLRVHYVDENGTPLDGSQYIVSLTKNGTVGEKATFAATSFTAPEGYELVGGDITDVEVAYGKDKDVNVKVKAIKEEKEARDVIVNFNVAPEEGQFTDPAGAKVVTYTIKEDSADQFLVPTVEAKEGYEFTGWLVNGKEEGFWSADAKTFGITGLETSVALTITELVDKGVLTPLQMAERMSYTPAQIIKSDRGTLLEGRPADITIIDPADEYVIDSSMFASMGKNTPFNGKTVKGRVRYTIAGGKTVYSYRPGCECIVDKDVPKL